MCEINKALEHWLRFIPEPIQNILLVLCNPFYVGGGSLNGLIHCQGTRAETHLSIIFLELLQLSQQTKHKMSMLLGEVMQSDVSQHKSVKLYVITWHIWWMIYCSEDHFSYNSFLISDWGMQKERSSFQAINY